MEDGCEPGLRGFAILPVAAHKETARSVVADRTTLTHQRVAKFPLESSHNDWSGDQCGNLQKPLLSGRADQGIQRVDTL